MSTESWVVVLTAIPAECAAVLSHLTDVGEIIHQGTVYKTGRFGHWCVAVVVTGAGNQRATLETERAISRFNPTFVFFIGVAGGLKDVEIGDVVASSKIYGYESGKVDAMFLARPDVGESGYALEQRARIVAMESVWQVRISENFEREVTAVVGPIAAGEKVIANSNSPEVSFLKEHYGDALCVDMEGRGTLLAVRANSGVQAIVIRGISDKLDGKANSDKQGTQDWASASASAFAFEVLAQIRPNLETDGEFLRFIDNLLVDAADESKLLSSTLLKVFSLLESKLSHYELFMLRGDLEGYSTNSVYPELPDYRYVFGRAMLALRDGAHIPINFSDPSWHDQLGRTRMANSIRELEDLLSRAESGQFQVFYNSLMEAAILSDLVETYISNNGYRGDAQERYRSARPFLLIDASEITGLVSKCRVRLIDLLKRCRKRVNWPQLEQSSSTLAVLQQFTLCPKEGVHVSKVLIEVTGDSIPAETLECEMFGLKSGAKKRAIFIPGLERSEYGFLFADLDESLTLSGFSRWTPHEVEVSLRFCEEAVEVPDVGTPRPGKTAEFVRSLAQSSRKMEALVHHAMILK